MNSYVTRSSEETVELGKKIGRSLRPGDILALEGALAVGKTTITKGIAASMGIEEDITSPTFTLVSEYEGNMPLYHFDVYRLGGADDFINLGADDMLYGRGVCVIEWSDKIRGELPDTAIPIHIQTAEDGSRLIEITNWPYGDLS